MVGFVPPLSHNGHCHKHLPARSDVTAAAILPRRSYESSESDPWRHRPSALIRPVAVVAGVGPLREENAAGFREIVVWK